MALCFTDSSPRPWPLSLCPDWFVRIYFYDHILWSLAFLPPLLSQPCGLISSVSRWPQEVGFLITARAPYFNLFCSKPALTLCVPADRIFTSCLRNISHFGFLFSLIIWETRRQRQNRGSSCPQFHSPKCLTVTKTGLNQSQDLTTQFSHRGSWYPASYTITWYPSVESWQEAGNRS